MTATEIKIDPEFRDLIPPLLPDEREQLEANIIREGGATSPLQAWGDLLLDGHNRYEICLKHKLPFTVSTVAGISGRDDAKAWIITNQFGRRNLTPFVRAELALKLEPLIATKAKAQQIRKPESVSQKSVKQKIDTQKEVAKAAKVSHDTIHKVKKIAAKAPDPVKQKLRAGETSINAAYTEIVRAEREEKREERRKENAAKISRVGNPVAAGAKFATIVIDPPWDWGDEGDVNQMGRAKPDYATMSIEKLRELPVEKLADDDAHIYLWITNRSMPKGFELLEKWGFRYVTMLTWPKPSFGMGNYFRGQTEHVLFGVRGSQQLKRKDASTLLPAWSRGKQHSSKPGEFFEFVESCSPGPFIEMFSRESRHGWSAWGEGGD